MFSLLKGGHFMKYTISEIRSFACLMHAGVITQVVDID